MLFGSSQLSLNCLQIVAVNRLTVAIQLSHFFGQGHFISHANADVNAEISAHTSDGDESKFNKRIKFTLFALVIM